NYSLAGVLLHIVGEVLVGNEQDVVGVDGVDYLDRIGGRAARVGLGFDVGGAVYVRDDLQVRIEFYEFSFAICQRFGRDRIRQRAAGAQIGYQHRARGVHDL